MNPNPRHARTKARRAALQALYQWQLTAQDPVDIERQFKEEDLQNVDFDYFHILLHEIPKHVSGLNDYLIPLIDRPLKELDPVELAAMRIGIYELCHCPDVPYRVAINEAVELAKRFGAEQSHKYVNGVLDKVAQQVRAEEMQAK